MVRSDFRDKPFETSKISRLHPHTRENHRSGTSSASSEKLGASKQIGGKLDSTTVQIDHLDECFGRILLV